MKCRHCGTPLEHIFLDLGFAPPSNAYLSAHQLSAPETTLPLRLFICDNCWLVQTEDFSKPADLFDFNYAYYSSTSKTWLDHARVYTQTVTERFGLNSDSYVVEIASNDGYLLRNFLVPGIPCLGIEPTRGTAEVAENLGIPVLREFFNSTLARNLALKRKADLVIGNNVYAHVPDINDFTIGMREILSTGGVITLEFPHLLQLIENNQFDTVYHEHFSYLSLQTVCRIFDSCDLKVWDVEQFPTHGGSLRIYGGHKNGPMVVRDSVRELLERERAAGLSSMTLYDSFQAKANRVKDDLLVFLIEQKRKGSRVAAYGAAAKGNTLLNYAGVKPDLLKFVCDAASAKQGNFLPGSHIPILSPSALEEYKPDFVLILPWNIADEVKLKLASLREFGTRFVVAVPSLTISD
jgi:hypothetical protein